MVSIDHLLESKIVFPTGHRMEVVGWHLVVKTHCMLILEEHRSRREEYQDTQPESERQHPSLFCSTVCPEVWGSQVCGSTSMTLRIRAWDRICAGALAPLE